MAEMTNTRRVPLSGTVNTRDLGGYATSYGKPTRFGCFLRSDFPLVLSEADIAYLLDRNIRTVIDMRPRGDRHARPGPFRESGRFSCFGFSFAHGNAAPAHEEQVPVVYGEMLSCRETYRRIFERMAAAEGGVLFHCVSGKDRTGMLAALLLLLCGVDLSDVLADYEVSYTYLRHIMRDYKQAHPEVPAFFGRSDFEYMEITLEALLKRYGTADNYLLECGVASGALAAVRQKLLAP